MRAPDFVAQRGSTLIETVFATLVASLVLITVVSLITVSLRNAAYAKEKVLSTKYAQEVIELFRRERQNMGWETFVSSSLKNGGGPVTYCFSSTTNPLPTTDSAFQTWPAGACATNQFLDSRSLFQRSAVVSQPSAGTLKVDVQVNWQEGSILHQSEQVQYFQQMVN